MNHITQEQAAKLMEAAEEAATKYLRDEGEFHPNHYEVEAMFLCNAAIQHYIDSRKYPDDVNEFMNQLCGPAANQRAALAQPVSAPDAFDLINASSYASSLGFLSGTSNWAAAMQRHLAEVAPPAPTGEPT
jgi:hypothetical protein